MSCANKFWLENLGALLSSTDIVPTTDMSLEKQFNAITRIVLIIFIIMWLFDFKHKIEFLLCSITFIIILYYIQKNTSRNCLYKENYEYNFNPQINKINSNNKQIMNLSKNKNTNTGAKGNIRTYNNVVENYEPPRNTLLGTTPTQQQTHAPFINTTIPNKNSGVMFNNGVMPAVLRNKQVKNCPTFCNDDTPMNSNLLYYMSPNQALREGANPNTKIAPIIVPPSHDLSFWGANNLVVHSQINETPQIDNYLSGYAVSTCCGVEQKRNAEQNYYGKLNNKFATKFNNMETEDDEEQDESKENYRAPKPMDVYSPIASIPVQNPDPTNAINKFSQLNINQNNKFNSINQTQNKNNNCKENYLAPKPMDVYSPIPTLQNDTEFQMEHNQFDENLQQPIGKLQNEGFDEDNNIVENYYNYSTYETPRCNEDGWVNTSMGYNPEQAEVNLPTNILKPNCAQDPRLSNFNKNLNTQIIQPGMYSTTQLNPQINNNAGISFQQQFQPLTINNNQNGLTYEQHDPRIIPPPPIGPPDRQVEPNVANVYDPRFSGYGTSYRSYVDPMTGQVRYAYDDVNAIRMPNYIARNKIDIYPFADSYGPMKQGEEFGTSLESVKSLANQTWDNSSLMFRGELMERLMRKRNGEMAQVREAPKQGGRRF